MHIIRFILPFLFVRNWYNGSWEFSRARGVLFLSFLFIIMLGIVIAYILQAPVTYSSIV